MLSEAQPHVMTEKTNLRERGAIVEVPVGPARSMDSFVTFCFEDRDRNI